MRFCLLKIVKLFIIGSALLTACKKGTSNQNKAPDTFISIESINLSGENRLQTVVRLNWYGADEDGIVKGYEISIDNGTWFYTEKQDSTFRFNITSGSDTADINFQVRALDLDGLIDETPAKIRIPVRNTPPLAIIDEDIIPKVSTKCVLTFQWNATDVDGSESIRKAFIKINEGDWFEINVNNKLVSLVPENPTATGNVNCKVYYFTSSTPDIRTINGFKLNDSNRVFVKVVDVANSESPVDTSANVFVSNKTGDMLFINGQSNLIRDGYKAIFDNIYANNYDLIDFAANNGQNQPKLWNPSFTLLVNLYKKLFINTDPGLFNNPISGQNLILLEFAAPSIQSFLDNGGRMLITSTFSNGQNIDNIKSILPIENLIVSPGQVRIFPDSAIVPQVSGNYPSLKPSSTLLGIDPFVKAADAELFYTAQLTKLQGWNSDEKTIAARRIIGGKVRQVFFSVELLSFNQNPNDLTLLFNKIFNEDFQ
jgi:hypothetical protein